MIPDTCNFIAGELCERSGLVSNDVISFCLSVPGWVCTGRETRKWEAKWRKQGGGNTQQKTGNEVSTFFSMVKLSSFDQERLNSLPP